MAFATANVRYNTQGNLKQMAGEWTGLQNDASGTVTIGGSRIYDVRFWDQGTASPKEWTQVDVTEASNASVVTVHNHRTVTSGRFIITYA